MPQLVSCFLFSDGGVNASINEGPEKAMCGKSGILSETVQQRFWTVLTRSLHVMNLTCTVPHSTEPRDDPSRESLIIDGTNEEKLKDPGVFVIIRHTKQDIDITISQYTSVAISRTNRSPCRHPTPPVKRCRSEVDREQARARKQTFSSSFSSFFSSAAAAGAAPPAAGAALAPPPPPEGT